MSLDPGRPGSPIPPSHTPYKNQLPGIAALTKINVAFDLSIVISAAYTGRLLDPEDYNKVTH